MARDEPSRFRLPPGAVDAPGLSLVGPVNQAMVEKLRDALAGDDGESDLVIELTTSGGDAELGRRLALDLGRAAMRRKGRLLLVGKTEVYSAGVTAMAGVPREHRFLTRDTMLLIHCRQLEKTLSLSGPLRGNLPKLDAVRREIEVGVELERQGFEQLIAGSEVTIDEVFDRALAGWFLDAEEAKRRGLVADVV